MTGTNGLVKRVIQLKMDEKVHGLEVLVNYLIHDGQVFLDDLRLDASVLQHLCSCLVIRLVVFSGQLIVHQLFFFIQELFEVRLR